MPSNDPSAVEMLRQLRIWRENTVTRSVAPGFIVRVELHDIPDGGHKDEYAKLHAAMRDESFVRNVVADGDEFGLPSAEYYRADSLNTLETLEAAKRAVITLKRRFSVVVTKAEQILVCWLEPAHKSDSATN